ncbi:ribosomal protein L20 [Thalictrum thalictroides]|uniref:Ribosomal protein L20 n=1 Tax=Thalictrum thalictroides TaxID=46969 RepID=A0A7J6VRB7_THATH|nr:ribosomal protein L20 [Thalictrum thalictroides]
MQSLQRILSRLSISPAPRIVSNRLESIWVSQRATFSGESSGSRRGRGEGGSNDDGWSNGWDSVESSENTPQQTPGFEPGWSTGLTENDFEGEAVGLQIAPPPPPPSVLSKTGTNYPHSRPSSFEKFDEKEEWLKEQQEESRKSKAYADSWDTRWEEVNMLLKQVMEPGARGSYLKDSEKAEMYRLHKENPEVYTIERLAKDYRIMRQRVHAILWLKEIEEEEEKKLGHPLDDSVERLLDECPEFFTSHDREFHVASLPYKPEFKVMPEGWDGTTRDLDEVHYEISMKEDEMLYQEFVQRMNFNKKKMAGEVKVHKYSRRRSSKGWNITVEKLGARGKRGGGGGWKFVSLPDGSSRPLNEMEKMYVKRETFKRRRKILP